MQCIFGQVHWRTLRNFNDKKAPESCDAGAFLLPKIIVSFQTLFELVQLVAFLQFAVAPES
jgi:hypothetical protein